MATTTPSLSTQPSTRLQPKKRQLVSILILCFLLLIVGLGLWRWRAAAPTITVVIDGEPIQVISRAKTPEALLASLGYTLRPEDELVIEGGWGDQARVVLHRARPVRVIADGRSFEIWTRGERVADLLQDANLSISPADSILLQGQTVHKDALLPPVEWRPPEGRRQAPPWQRIPIPLTLTIQRANPIQITEENVLTRTIWTQQATVIQALNEYAIPIYEGDVILPGLDVAVEPGMHVYIYRATPFTLYVDGQTIQGRTRQKTVGDALRELGIFPLGEDLVDPPLDAELHEGATIRVTRVIERIEYEEELLPFETVWEPDDTLLIDTRVVGQEGRPGVLRRRYRVRYENGQEVARELEDEWVAQEPERKVILYGRKIVPRTAMTPDGPITYWRKIRAYTTSYSPSRSGTDPSLPWYGHTRLGFKAGKGIVGVDPSVINMSQKLYVPGYGFAIAGDTGNLSGKHVDMGFDDDNYESWHWWSDVYLLWPPPPTYAINYILPNWPRYKGSKNPYDGLVQEGP